MLGPLRGMLSSSFIPNKSKSISKGTPIALSTVNLRFGVSRYKLGAISSKILTSKSISSCSASCSI